MSQTASNPNAKPTGEGRVIAHLAALVSAERMAALTPVCVELADLSKLSASEAGDTTHQHIGV